MLGIQSINALVVSLKKTDDTDGVAAGLKISSCVHLEIKTWTELNDFYEKTVELYKSQFGFLQLIILVMVLLSVANSVNMSIFERTGEFGTMMALGNRRDQVFWLIIAESSLLGVMGAGRGLAWHGARDGHICDRYSHASATNSDMSYTAHIQLTPMLLIMSFSSASRQPFWLPYCLPNTFPDTCRRCVKAKHLT